LKVTGGWLVSAQFLRERFAREFITMSRYSPGVAWGCVAFYIAQLIGAVLLGAWLLKNGVSASESMAILALMLFVGTRFRALNNIVHECSHASFVRVREVNSTIGKICSALTLGSFVAYRHEHLSHHAHLGDYERDLDLQGIEAMRLHDPLTVRVILRHAVTPFIFRHLPHYLSVDLSLADGRAFQVMKLGLLALVVGLTVVAPLTMALFVILPYVVIYSALNYWADCLDHAGLIPGEDDLDGSRNVLAPKVLAWLLFPRNDGYHLVHHLFPNVPARHLSSAHNALMQDPVYRSTPNAVRGLPETAADDLAKV